MSLLGPDRRFPGVKRAPGVLGTCLLTLGLLAACDQRASSGGIEDPAFSIPTEPPVVDETRLVPFRLPQPGELVVLPDEDLEEDRRACSIPVRLVPGRGDAPQEAQAALQLAVWDAFLAGWLELAADLRAGRVEGPAEHLRLWLEVPAEFPEAGEELPAAGTWTLPLDALSGGRSPVELACRRLTLEGFPEGTGAWLLPALGMAPSGEHRLASPALVPATELVVLGGTGIGEGGHHRGVPARLWRLPAGQEPVHIVWDESLPAPPLPPPVERPSEDKDVRIFRHMSWLLWEDASLVLVDDRLPGVWRWPERQRWRTFQDGSSNGLAITWDSAAGEPLDLWPGSHVGVLPVAPPELLLPGAEEVALAVVPREVVVFPAGPGAGKPRPVPPLAWEPAGVDVTGSDAVWRRSLEARGVPPGRYEVLAFWRGGGQTRIGSLAFLDVPGDRCVAYELLAGSRDTLPSLPPSSGPHPTHRPCAPELPVTEVQRMTLPHPPPGASAWLLGLTGTGAGALAVAPVLSVEARAAGFAVTATGEGRLVLAAWNTILLSGGRLAEDLASGEVACPEGVLQPWILCGDRRRPGPLAGAWRVPAAALADAGPLAVAARPVRLEGAPSDFLLQVGVPARPWPGGDPLVEAGGLVPTSELLLVAVDPALPAWAVQADARCWRVRAGRDPLTLSWDEGAPMRHLRPPAACPPGLGQVLCRYEDGTAVLRDYQLWYLFPDGSAGALVPAELPGAGALVSALCLAPRAWASGKWTWPERRRRISLAEDQQPLGVRWQPGGGGHFRPWAESHVSIVLVDPSRLLAAFPSDLDLGVLPADLPAGTGLAWGFPDCLGFRAEGDTRDSLEAWSVPPGRYRLVVMESSDAVVRLASLGFLEVPADRAVRYELLIE